MFRSYFSHEKIGFTGKKCKRIRGERVKREKLQSLPVHQVSMIAMEILSKKGRYRMSEKKLFFESSSLLKQ